MKGRKKFNSSKYTNPLQSPCTIEECVRISRAAAEDVCESSLKEYNKQVQPYNISAGLHIDVLRELLIDKGVFSKSEYEELYTKKAIEFNQMQDDLKKKREQKDEDTMSGDCMNTIGEGGPRAEMSSGDIEVIREEALPIDE